MSGRMREENDPVHDSEEGGSAHSSSESSRDNEVTTSSSEHLKGEMRSKKRQDVRAYGTAGGNKKTVKRGRGRQVASKERRWRLRVREGGESLQEKTNDEGEDGGLKQAAEGVDVITRHCCVLEAVCALNDQLSDIHKEAMRGNCVEFGVRV
ncbi:hypothetical protein Cgig2_026170 [Carnegiea gigantea]|uniref:Uncharacterized protein n=1 Tax=Carnegiea gigantea TaxID=171969 RepID=A0A9Q1QCV8_9CARY|nr:hypothetical protein Cgig2_026170 [Carnegiea gigantea]